MLVCTIGRPSVARDGARVSVGFLTQSRVGRHPGTLIKHYHLAKMRLMMVASLLPAAMAAFDKCARPNGEWAGFDQVITLHRCTDAPMRLTRL